MPEELVNPPGTELEAAPPPPENVSQEGTTDGDPEPEVISAPEKPEAPAGDEAPAPPPAYVPNTKFKAMKEEKEFEDWVKPMLSKDNEAKVRELHEKAYALDPIKAERDQFRTENVEVKKQFTEFYDEVQRLGSLSQKDFGHFLDELQIPKDKVFQWVREQLQVEGLPEEQKKIYYENEQLKREKYNDSQKVSSTSQAYVDQITQARVNDLTNVLNDSSVANHVQAFETRLGRPGAFADMVIRHAKTEWETSQGKRDLSAKDAVTEVLNILGMSTQSMTQPVPAPSQGAIPKGPATPPPTVIPAVKPTVIPNVGSGTSSASVKLPKSINDLRKIAKEMNG